MGLPAINYGFSKGLEFERVLIFPTGPIIRWLSSGDSSAISRSSAKLYVAITRASQSVAFVHDRTCAVPGIDRWNADS